MVDRPYGQLINYLHCNIGSTHVVHHLFSRIPHYHAPQATRSIATAYPHLYRYDDTPIGSALASGDAVRRLEAGRRRYVVLLIALVVLVGSAAP